MITRAVAAGTPARLATGDEVYGADPELRQTTAGLRAGLRVRGRVQPHRHHHDRHAAGG